MQEIVYHGSSVDIKDATLKPLGWARHLEKYGVYLTESELVGLAYAFDYYNGNPGFEPEDFKDITFYNSMIQDYEYTYIVKTPETPIGYIYEAKRPSELPVEFFDEKTNEAFPEYRPGAKAIFAIAHEVEILHKHTVNYNYLKQKPSPIKVLVLKKTKDFTEATKKIQEKLRAIQDASPSKMEHAIQEYRDVLAEYTDR